MTVAVLWWRWLWVANASALLFGAAMVLAPGPTRQFFGLLLYARSDAIDAFGSGAVAYITLLHAVLGAVMVGWAVALMCVLHGPFRRGERSGWTTLAASLVAWFVPDTLRSLVSGFWPNALFNLMFATLFAVPLVATWRAFHAPCAESGIILTPTC